MFNCKPRFHVDIYPSSRPVGISQLIIVSQGKAGQNGRFLEKAGHLPCTLFLLSLCYFPFLIGSVSQEIDSNLPFLYYKV